MSTLSAPFPYIGGKSSIAPRVWERLGDCPNYCEPFVGSAAMLLARPDWHTGRIETVNDADGLLSNFWRALQADPDCVAHHADWIVSECDLHARHAWLVNHREDITRRLEGDPEWYDARAAGWWVWGAALWIGGGWCSGEGPWQVDANGELNAIGGGINRKLPHLGNAGRGINRKLPHLGCAGQGINRKLPHLGCAEKGACAERSEYLRAVMQALANRLRGVRVCCGDWSRICGPTPTVKNGLTAVFLDPPYTAAAGRDMGLYAKDCGSVGHDVFAWAAANGENPMMRIALCGYEGEYPIPPGWECALWKAHGGYGNQGDGAGRVNSKRERVWFSKFCLKPGLFSFDSEGSQIDSCSFGYPQSSV